MAVIHAHFWIADSLCMGVSQLVFWNHLHDERMAVIFTMLNVAKLRDLHIFWLQLHALAVCFLPMLSYTHAMLIEKHVQVGSSS